MPCVCDDVTKSWLRRRDEGAAAARGRRTKERDGWRHAGELEPSPTADDLMQHLICAQRRELTPAEHGERWMRRSATGAMWVLGWMVHRPGW